MSLMMSNAYQNINTIFCSEIRECSKLLIVKKENIIWRETIIQMPSTMKVESPLTIMKRGLKAGFPIMLGYLPIAITYGVLASQVGLSLFELTWMSAAVFAGASQFMAVNMIAVGTGIIEIIIATFVLNFRHFIMNLSMMNVLKAIPLHKKLPLSLGVTDETFAVSSMYPEEGKKAQGIWFYGTIMGFAYISWVIGSLFGGLLGEIIPPALSQSMGIALYAMFIGLLIPSAKKDIKVAYIAVVAMFIHWGCLQLGISTGWAIVYGTIFGGMVGIPLLKEDEA